MVLLLILFSCGVACQHDGISDSEQVLGSEENPVIYGEDERMDYYAHSNEQLKTITRESIVALIDQSILDLCTDPNDVQINAATLEDAYSLCPSEAFLDQPTAASCSGTLIDDDLVLTAGHCVENDAD